MMGLMIGAIAVAPASAEPANVSFRQGMRMANYQKYSHDPVVLGAYLKGLGDGFQWGVQGYAAHLVFPGPELSTGTAHITGYIEGYSQGLETFRSISGKKGGYRAP